MSSEQHEDEYRDDDRLEAVGGDEDELVEVGLDLDDQNQDQKQDAGRYEGGAIPLAAQAVDECVLPRKAAGATPCTPTPDIVYMRNFLHGAGTRADKLADAAVVAQLQKALAVSSESEIWTHPEWRAFVGEDRAKKVVKYMFKPRGPKDSTALLDNFNIDETMAQWMTHSARLFPGRKFYHVPFQMIDFAARRTELARLDLRDLKAKGYNCFGVVLNTDVSTGRGKHWFCLFGDLAHKGTESDPWQIEYFNSSGNTAVPEVSIWLEETCHQLLRDVKIHCEIVRSAPIRLQHSQTECGVWSLMYIRSRLEGHPPDWFYAVAATDADMIALRRHFFR